MYLNQSVQKNVERERMCLPALIFSNIVLKSHGSLTHYHTMPHFDTLMRYRCGKHCETRRNLLKQAISPFLTMFSTLYGFYVSF